MACKGAAERLSKGMALGTTFSTESADSKESIISVDECKSFEFVPRELAIRCRKMIESYHAKEGYACLPDMLWRSNARHIIERSRDLAQIFKSASKSKRAKQSYENLLYLATVVVSLEVLARNFMGWGRQFPAARHEAEEILSEPLIHSRPWLVDEYLHPSLGNRRLVAKMLELPTEN
jgi:hypothetical protein